MCQELLVARGHGNKLQQWQLVFNKWTHKMYNSCWEAQLGKAVMLLTVNNWLFSVCNFIGCHYYTSLIRTVVGFFHSPFSAILIFPQIILVSFPHWLYSSSLEVLLELDSSNTLNVWHSHTIHFNKYSITRTKWHCCVSKYTSVIQRYPFIESPQTSKHNSCTSSTSKLFQGQELISGG